MKIILSQSLICISGLGVGQTRPAPFSEASKAIYRTERQELIYDSLRGAYKGKLSIDVLYGQRHISKSNQLDRVDTVTFANFADRNSFYGLGVNYFLRNNLSVGFQSTISFLPRRQDVNFDNGSGGISGEGRGSGGVLLTLEFISKYFITTWGNHWRPYGAVKFGMTNLAAKGGEVSFSLLAGRNDDIRTAKKQVPTGQLLLGISHRASPVCILDFNTGYAFTEKTDPIGQINSPGGITASLTLKFIVNPGLK